MLFDLLWVFSTPSHFNHKAYAWNMFCELTTNITHRKIYRLTCCSIFFRCRCVMTTRQYITFSLMLSKTYPLSSIDFHLVGLFFHLLLSDKSLLLAILNANALCVCMCTQCFSMKSSTVCCCRGHKIIFWFIIFSYDIQ